MEAEEIGRLLQAVGGLSIAAIGFVLTVLAIIIEVYLPVADDWWFVALPSGPLASIVTEHGAYGLLRRV